MASSTLTQNGLEVFGAQVGLSRLRGIEGKAAVEVGTLLDLDEGPGAVGVGRHSGNIYIHIRTQSRNSELVAESKIEINFSR